MRHHRRAAIRKHPHLTKRSWIWCEKPHILGLPDVVNIEISEARSPLSPRLIAHCQSQDVAIDIRAPDVNAARSVVAAAANYSSRIAVLLLKYETVIMVMPEKARQYADATLELLEDWVRDSIVLDKRVKLALASEQTLTYLAVKKSSQNTSVESGQTSVQL